MATRLLFATDLHGNKSSYEELFALAQADDVDVLVLGGDLLPLPLGQGVDLIGIQQTFITEFLRPALRDLHATGPLPVYGILGNDDWAANLDLVAGLEEEGLFTNLHLTKHRLDETHWISGYSCVPLTPFRMSDWDRYDTAAWVPKKEPNRLLLTDTGSLREGSLREIRQRPTLEEDLLELSRCTEPATTVYVCHTPPYGTNLDRMHGGASIGSHALRAFVETHQPPLTLHGHVHESPRLTGEIQDRIGETLCINPGDSRSQLRVARIELGERAKLIEDGA